MSYIDHDLPSFTQDGTIITTTGAEAKVDDLHHAADFPAYWDAGLRQYLYYDGHNGFDYNLWYQPVYAAAPGRVIFAAFEYPSMPASGYGRMVMIEHSHGYVTLYGHFSKLLVKKGQHVKRGQRIGTSGNTGHSSGPHLHFTVFHNCTPVDPYGWNGSGPDPLAAYQGESSTYLWERQPLILNPPPGWPDLQSLPAPSADRILLLRLPSTAGGTSDFTSSLQAEGDLVVRKLEAQGATAKLDLVRGTVDVTGAVPAGRLLALPDVVSITTSGTIEGAQPDVLQALARAALASHRKRVTLDRRHAWTGFLLKWQGRVLLVGKGKKAASARLRLENGRGGASAHAVTTDPRTGAYAIDLGHLSNSEYTRIRRSLQTKRHTSDSPSVSSAPVRKHAPAPAHSHAGAKGQTSSWELPVLAIAGLLLIASGGLAEAWRRGMLSRLPSHGR